MTLAAVVFSWIIGATPSAWGQSAPMVDFKIDSGAIVAPLAAPGDPRRGERTVQDKGSSCVLCHAVPGAQGPMGNLAPPLNGVGARRGAGELRLRLVDSTRINPDSIMPPYYRIDNLHQVAPAYRGKTLLDAQQIEDVVAYLLELKAAP